MREDLIFDLMVLQPLIHSLVEMFPMDPLKKSFMSGGTTNTSLIINLSFQLSVYCTFPFPQSILSFGNKDHYLETSNLMYRANISTAFYMMDIID